MESSMQPIFSAINHVHRDLDFEPPAVDNHFLRNARKGLARSQVDQGGARDSRVPLPAQAVLDVVGHALGPAGTENLCISKQGLLSEDPCVTWAQRVSDVNGGPETSKGDLARVERHDARVVAEVLELVA